MPDLTLVLGPEWARFAKRINSSDDIDAADQLPKLLEFEECDVTGIDDLHDILNLLRLQRNTCVIRGQLREGVEQPCRRLLRPRVEDGVHYDATVVDVPRAWVMVDFDSVPEPPGVVFTRDPEACAAYLRSQLPAAFHDARCVWQASGAAGFKPGIRLHLWFLLDRALRGDEARAWLSYAALPLDRTLFGAVQPHFTSDPEFAEGIPDPMPVRLGLLDGAHERVHVPAQIPPDRLEPARVRVPGASPRDDREIDPFVRIGLEKWEADHPWEDAPDLSARFECPACGSSDGCCVLPDGKIFCHGDKHHRNASDIGHPAGNGYVMTRFEAVERVTWAQVPRRLQELGYYPGAPKPRAQHVRAPVPTGQGEDLLLRDEIDLSVADEMGAIVEGKPIVSLSQVEKARKKLLECARCIAADPERAESLAFDFGRRYVPSHFTRGAAFKQLVAHAKLFDADVEEAITRGLERAEREPYEEPVHALALDAQGRPERCLSNVIKLLNLPDFTDVLAYDIRAHQRLVTAQPPWLAPEEGVSYPRPVNDGDYTAIVVLLANNYDYPHATIGHVQDALALACDANRVDPVRDYFDSLPMFEGDLEDAKLVAGSWLTEFAGAPDDEYTRAVAMRWLIGAVARTYQPGCKNREVLTLIGPQNRGKSWLLQALCPNKAWFKEDFDIHGKDAAQSLLGTMIVEIAELDKLVSTDRHGALKSFISTSVDKYRPPYGHEFVTVERRSVFAATANPHKLFRDPTGNTRFNVVVTPDVDFNVPGLIAVRDELWTAARTLYLAGEQWHLDADERAQAVARQEQHREVNDAEVLLGALLETPTMKPHPGFSPSQYDREQTNTQGAPGLLTLRWVTTVQLMDYLRERGINKYMARQVHECMQRFGWAYTRHANGCRSGQRGFRRPDTRTTLDNKIDE